MAWVMGCSVAMTTKAETPEYLQPVRFEYSQVIMGLRVVVIGFAGSESAGQEAAKAAFAAFEHVDSVMSDYRKDSELMKLCGAQHNVFWDVSPDLWNVLTFADGLSQVAGGAFDVTCGPMVQLWRETRKTLKLPAPSQFETARAQTGFDKLKLHPKSRSACLTVPGMRLDLGGIAKGYACDLGLEALKSKGVHRAMIHAGGDMVFGASPPGKPGWTILIAGKSGAPLHLSHCALSTSGDSEQYYMIEGKRYSHVLDPRTGLGLIDAPQVSVISRRSMVSDALATTLCVVGEETGRAIAQKYDTTAIFVKRT